MLSQQKNGVPTVLALMSEDDENFGFLSEEKKKEVLDIIGSTTVKPPDQLTIGQTVAMQNQAIQNQTPTEKPNNILFWGLGAIALFFIFKK